MKFKVFFPVLLTAMFFAACSSSGEKTGSNESSSYNIDEIIKAADAISPDINSVNDVFETLDLVEAGYYSVLCNDPYNAPNYLSSKPVAAANLGVYVTDIVYHMYGDASESMFLSFSASQELARYLGLESEFAATLLTELEGGMITRDSLILAFNELLSESADANSKDLAFVHTAFLTGMQIEKLFITSSLLDQAQKVESPSEQQLINYKKLLAVFRNQVISVDALTPSLENHSRKLEDLIPGSELQALRTSGQAFEAEVDALLKAEELKPSEKFKTFYTKLTSVRNSIVASS